MSTVPVKVTITVETAHGTMNVTQVQRVDKFGNPTETRGEVLKRAYADAAKWLRSAVI